MRRKPHVLVFVVGAAAVLLLSAPALGAAWLSPETAALTGVGTIQQSAAIAVDPATPLSAAVVADDDSVAASFPRTATSSASNWSTGPWRPPTTLTVAGSTSAGQGDITWGNGQTVYAVEARAVGGSLCMSSGSNSSGVYFSASGDSGANWGTDLLVNPGSNTSALIEPAIAFDHAHNRVYVAYAKLDWGTPNCSGAPDGSQIWLAYSDDQGTFWTSRRVSPLATTGAAHYRSPALDVLPDGRVVIAFRNESPPAAGIEAETCTLYPAPPTHYCGGASAGTVGPSVVLGDASAPALASGLAGAPTPSVVATSGSTTVAWHAGVGAAVRAFAAMSTNGGATFGPAQQIDPLGAGNQVAPRLAATAGGRVDVAYLWDPSASGIVSATSASAGPPLAGATTEAWSHPVVVQAVGASATTPISGQTAPLGRRLGVATASVSPSLSPLPATVVAFTDTSTGSQDVRVVGLLHGTTAPAISAQTVTVSKNATTIVHLNATDVDGDPLTWSVGAQPTTPGSTVSAADAARGDFAFSAANIVGTDTFEAVASDGVAGNTAHAVINVNVVNDPPEITCQTLVTQEDKPLTVPVDSCVTDPNKDPVTVTLDSATGGTVQRVKGEWIFSPAPKSKAPGSFVMHATDDGGKSAEPRRITVTIAANATPVTLEVVNAGKRRELARGKSLRLSGHAVDALGSVRTITWNFGDGTPTASGSAVAHRFRKSGAFTVIATVASAPPVKVRVLVRQPAVEVIGSPGVTDGVMQVRVHTRTAGKLQFRVDSRSQTVTVPAGSHEQTLRMQVTSGPLVRVSLRLTPSKKKGKAPLVSLRMRRLVLVSPTAAG